VKNKDTYVRALLLRFALFASLLSSLQKHMFGEFILFLCIRPLRMPVCNGKGSEKGRPNRKTRPQQDKIHHFRHTVKKKILIVQQAYEVANRINPVAKKHCVDPSSVRQWFTNLEALKEKALINPNAKTAHFGPELEDVELKTEVKNWVLEQWLKDLVVRMCDIVHHAISIWPNFRCGSKKKVDWWVYSFIGWSGLLIQCITRVGQKLTGHLEEVRQDTAAAIISHFLPGGTLHGIERKYFINMDQPSAHYELKSSTMVSEVGLASVPACDSEAMHGCTGSGSRWFKVATFCNF